MSLNLITVRQLSGQVARNAINSTQYPDAIKDLAFAQRADELIRRAWLLLTLNQITTTANSNVVPTGGGAGQLPTAFRPDRIKQAYLSGGNVIITPYLGSGYSPYYSIGAPVNPTTLYRTAKLQLPPFIDVLNKTLAYQSNPPLAQPTEIAFDQLSGSGLFWPTPDQVYTVNIQWNQLFTQWTYGAQGPWSGSANYYLGDVVSSGGHTYQALVSNTNIAVGTASTWSDLGAGSLATPASITFALPDDYILPIIMKGVRATLLQNDKDNSDLAATAIQEWERYVTEMGAKGNLGFEYVDATPSVGMSGGYGEWNAGGSYGGILP